MGKIHNLAGRRFGRLTVVAYEATRNGYAYWRCSCDCGAEVIARGTKLLEGRHTSCGCLRADPAFRQAARSQVPAKRRREIAAMGGAARKSDLAD
jgi:hypothetical protein